MPAILLKLKLFKFGFFPFFSATTPLLYLAALVFIALKKTEIPKAYRLFIYLLSIAFISEITMLVLSELGRNNLFVTHLYYPIEFGLFFFMLSSWDREYQTELNIIGTIALVIVSSLCLFVEVWNLFPSIAYTIQNILLFFLAIRIIYIIAIDSSLPFLTSPKFYITLALLIFSSVNSVGFLAINYFELRIPMLAFHTTNIITNTMYAYSLIRIYLNR